MIEEIIKKVSNQKFLFWVMSFAGVLGVLFTENVFQEIGFCLVILFSLDIVRRIQINDILEEIDG